MKANWKIIIPLVLAALAFFGFWWSGQAPDRQVAEDGGGVVSAPLPSHGDAADGDVAVAREAESDSEAADAGESTTPEADTGEDVASDTTAEDAPVSESAEAEAAESGAEPEADVAVEPAQEDAPVEEDTAEAPEAAPSDEAETDIAQSDAGDAKPADSESVETAEADGASRIGDAPPKKSTATFDLVRVEPGGSTVIAGRTAPGADIALLMDGKEIATTKADNTGGFVVFAELGSSETPRVLSMRETQENGTVLEAEANVIVAAVPEAPKPEITAGVEEPQAVPLDENEPVGVGREEVAAVEPDADATDAETVVVEAETNAGSEEGASEEAPQVAAVAPEQPAVPTVLLADESGIRVVQSSGDQAPALSNISIDSISYDDAGEVALAGRATGSSAVRVYLNNQPLIDGVIGPNGQWTIDLPDIDTGTYTLRVDELDADGAVISRAETPFRREPIEAIRALEAETELSLAPVSLMTVQPGNTLWGIAREKYGEGPLFVRVFDANTDRIRDPDLIYPGQIFTLPDE